MAIVTADISIVITAGSLADLSQVYDRMNDLNANEHGSAYTVTKDDGALTITITRTGMEANA